MKIKNILKNKYDIDNIVIFHNQMDLIGITSKHCFNVTTFKDYYSNLDSPLNEEDISNI